MTSPEGAARSGRIPTMSGKQNFDELEKSVIFFLESLADIMGAGGRPFVPALEVIRQVLGARPVLNPENLKRQAFSLSNQAAEIAAKVEKGTPEVKAVRDTAPVAVSNGEPSRKGGARVCENGLTDQLVAIVHHVVSIRPTQFQAEERDLADLIKSEPALDKLFQKILDLVIKVRDSLWEERSRAFKQIGEVLRSLEDTEQDFIKSLSSTQSHLAEAERGFADAMQNGLREIGSLVAPGAIDLEALCGRILEKVDKLTGCVEQKRQADQARLEALDAERHLAEERLAKSRRDYEDFSRQSHEMLEEIEKLKAVSLRDPLTNVYNRRAYDSQVEKTLAAYAGGTLKTCSLIVFDIDHFRDFNNTYGHLAGDRILAYVARLTREALRNDDLIFRYGGDEFVIIAPNAGLESAAGVAEKIRRGITSVEFKLFKSSDLTVKVGISMGVTEMRKGDDAVSLFNRADQALYHAKTAGRNQVSVQA